MGDPRYVRPSGDRRERPVACLHCRQQTFALNAVCDDCHEREAEVAR